jgi:catechol 2,3-dioxygenase-like lactoylglutathione lyase family enzyme
VTPSMTDLYAGIPVTDRDAALRWYESFFGRRADEVVAGEAMWAISAHAWVFVEEQSARAGGGLLTIGIDGLDALLAGLAERGIARGPVETYSDGVRHVTVLDPDGNSLSFAQAPSE